MCVWVYSAQTKETGTTKALQLELFVGAWGGDEGRKDLADCRALRITRRICLFPLSEVGQKALSRGVFTVPSGLCVYRGQTRGQRQKIGQQGGHYCKEIQMVSGAGNGGERECEGILCLNRRVDRPG
jgi:hypothetical protein